jgi:3-methyladenine DNA glycosylase AlkD
MHSPEELVGRAGWTLLIARILRRETDGLDFDTILKEIEAEILSAPIRKQEAMNRCLVEIGCHIPEFTQKCVDLGERLGRFDKRPAPKGCTSPYAPEWIAAVLKRKK